MKIRTTEPLLTTAKFSFTFSGLHEILWKPMNTLGFLKKIFAQIFSREKIKAQSSSITNAPKPEPPKTEKRMSNNRPNLYALLVGINNYKYHPGAQLDGCENDVNSMISMLNEPYMSSQFANGTQGVVKLIDADATKDNIIKLFREHLGKAKKGDTAMFYFSGHGLREETTVPAFKASELDGKIGGLFCNDSETGNINHKDKTFLADKELRYLIHELAEKDPHIVVLADCCHSGDNTRNIMNPSEQPKGKSRQIIRQAASNRAWEGFFFHKEIGEQNAQLLLTQPNTLDKVIPQGNHIQMAACREFEEAYEESGSGNFTRALTDIIKSHEGDITYQELQSRIRNRMRVKSPDENRPDYKVQVPQIYVCSDDVNDKYKNFLTGSQSEKPVDAAVIFNQSEGKWRINLGVIQAVPTDKATEVLVFPRGTDPDKDTSKVIKAQTVVGQVNAGYTQLSFPGGKEPAAGTAWMGRIKGLAIRPLNIYIDKDKAEKEAADFLVDFIEKQDMLGGSQYINLCDSADQADYIITTEKNHYVISAADTGYTVVEQVLYKARDENDEIELLDTAPKVVFALLIHMAKWTFLKDLNYDPEVQEGGDSTLNRSTLKKPVELKFFQILQDGSEVQLNVERGTIELDMTTDLNPNSFTKEARMPSTLARIELVNHSDTPLFCAVMHQSAQFGITKGMLAPTAGIAALKPADTDPNKKERFEVTLSKDEAVSWILPAEVYKGKEYPATNELQFGLKKYQIRDKWESCNNYIKLVVSAGINPPDLDLNQEDLPEAIDLSERSDLDVGKAKSLQRRRDPEPDPYTLPDTYWSIKTLEIAIINPQIKKSPYA